MTRTEIETSLNELNRLVLSGNTMEAFDKFYHDEVVMQENEFPPTASKLANRQRELDFFINISEFRGAEVKGMESEFRKVSATRFAPFREIADVRRFATHRPGIGICGTRIRRRRYSQALGRRSVLSASSIRDGRNP